jgi:hypothetical protein
VSLTKRVVSGVRHSHVVRSRSSVACPGGIGDVPVFPSETEPKEGTPRHTWQQWLRRAKDRWLRTVEIRRNGRAFAKRCGASATIPKSGPAYGTRASATSAGPSRKSWQDELGCPLHGVR